MKITFVDNKNRAEQLQFLRFCAFSLICLHHLSAWTWDCFPKEEGAYCAVSFFFILSGFVLAYSCFEKKIELTFDSFKSHLTKKIVKVYPLYFATTIVTILMSDIPGLISEKDIVGLRADSFQLLKNLLLVQSWFKEGIFSFNGVGWFLSSLVFISLLDMPFVYLGNKIKTNKKSVLWFTVGIAFSLVILFIYSIVFRDTNRKFMLYIIPVGRVWEYIIGICMGYIVRIIENSREKTNAIWSTILEVLCLALIFWLLYYDIEDWKSYTAKWVIPNAILLFVFGLGRGYVSKLFRLKILNILGDVSFECYLVHQVIIQILGEEYGYISLGGLANLFVIFIVFVETVILALLIHKRGC